MNTTIKIAIICIFAVGLTTGSCIKDSLYNTTHPELGAVEVTADWSGHSLDATLPESYILRIGNEEQTVNDECNAFQSLFAPGSQNLLIYNHADCISISGDIASVNVLDDGFVEPMPGYLFAAAQNLNIHKDDTLHTTVAMKQLIRKLIVNLKLNEGDEQRIAGSFATLTGIASSVNMTNGQITDKEGLPTFLNFSVDTYNPTSRTTGVPALTATMRLFGIISSEKQELSIAIALTNGTVQTIKTDLTEMLKNFGSGEMEPLVLDATLSLPSEVGTTATISDWNTVNNGDISIN